jgi:hypothetical protein
MTKMELILGIFVLVVIVYVLVIGATKLLKRDSKSENEIVKKSKERMEAKKKNDAK